MIAPPEKSISVEAFGKEGRRLLAGVQKKEGPIALTQDSEIIGVFLSLEEYEALQTAVLRKLLRSRLQGPTVPHEEVAARIREKVRRMKKRA